MPATALFSGPDPEGDQWCGLCAALVKGVAIAESQAALEALKDMPAEEVRWFAVRSNHGYPQPAVTLGYSPMFQQVIEEMYMAAGSMQFGQHLPPLLVPLCWSHLMGINVTAGLLPATQMPAGIPLIGQKR